MTAWVRWMALAGLWAGQSLAEPIVKFRCHPGLPIAKAIQKAADPAVERTTRLILDGCRPGEVAALVSHGSLPHVVEVILAPESLTDQSVRLLLTLKLPKHKTIFSTRHSDMGQWITYHRDTLAKDKRSRTDPFGVWIDENPATNGFDPNIDVAEFRYRYLGRREGLAPDPKMGAWLKARVALTSARIHPLTAERLALILNSQWTQSGVGELYVTPALHVGVHVAKDYTGAPSYWILVPNQQTFPFAFAGLKIDGARFDTVGWHTCGCGPECVRSWFVTGLFDGTNDLDWTFDGVPGHLKVLAQFPQILKNLNRISLIGKNEAGRSLGGGCASPLQGAILNGDAEHVSAISTLRDRRHIAKMNLDATVALLGSPHLQKLKTLHMPGMPVNDKAVLAFAATKKDNLLLLMLWGQITDLSTAALVRSPVVAQLQHLGLYGNFKEGFFEALRDSKHIKGIDEIRLSSGQCPTKKGMTALFQAKLVKLKGLVLQGFSLTGEQLLEFSLSPFARTVETTQASLREVSRAQRRLARTRLLNPDVTAGSPDWDSCRGPLPAKP